MCVVDRCPVVEDRAVAAGPDSEAGGRWRDHRQVIDAIAFKYRTGTAWMDPPEPFGSWKDAHNRLRKWAADGTSGKAFTTLLAEGDLDWIVAVDSTIVRAHQRAAGARQEVAPAGEPDDHALGRSRGGPSPSARDPGGDSSTLRPGRQSQNARPIRWPACGCGAVCLPPDPEGGPGAPAHRHPCHLYPVHRRPHRHDPPPRGPRRKRLGAEISGSPVTSHVLVHRSAVSGTLSKRQQDAGCS
ncbi:transposase [Streptomyces sp. NPDC006482]|uniref:transposase n=1 Tax=Streptomyces sp. NPDC006482 TaxID=3154306 RepID=UPI0033ABAF21